MIVTIEEMKNYLRVDFDDDDKLLEHFINTAQKLCMDVARINEEVDFSKEENSKIAVMYACAYLYENREDANHKELTITLRALLFGIRKEGF